MRKISSCEARWKGTNIGIQRKMTGPEGAAKIKMKRREQAEGWVNEKHKKNRN